MSKLRDILDHKACEVDRAKKAIPLEQIARMALNAPPVRPFKAALEAADKVPALIAEVKKASPSQGLIRADFDPAEVAAAYREAGAHCLSVLTDERYFQGSRANLEISRSISGLPCLRKDFIIDPYQVFESRAWGADCILLIVAAFSSPDSGLQTAELSSLWHLAKDLGMDVLVEVHSRAEAETAFQIGADLIGVNNRDLSDLTTSITSSDHLLPLVRACAFPVS